MKKIEPQHMFSGYCSIDNYYNFVFIRRTFMFSFAFLSSISQKHKPSISKPQVFHLVCSTRLGGKGLKPFY